MTLPQKKYHFKWSLTMIILILLLITETLPAQKKNYKITPEHLKIQYAGGTGFIAVGAGYTNRNRKLEADLYYGYLPKRIGGVTIHSISAKLVYIPIRAIRGKRFSLDPLMTGVVVNYSFGNQYFSFDPPNYPYRYYSFPTSIHSALFLGSRVGIISANHSLIDRLSFYYELLSFDRDIISLLSNPKSLHLPAIITLSLGVKINIE